MSLCRDTEASIVWWAFRKWGCLVFLVVCLLSELSLLRDTTNGLSSGCTVK